ncbi:MAG: V-type ATP synthase subunit I [Candidatus Thalassarchaeaceae archaeon]
MVGELTNRPMARFNAAGLRKDLDSVMHILCSLKAVDLIDFDGEEGNHLNLGSPRDDHDAVAKNLSTYRSISKWVESSRPEGTQSEKTVRGWINGELTTEIQSISETISEIEDKRSEANATEERIAALGSFVELGVDLDLFDGYRTATVFSGNIGDKGTGQDALQSAGVSGHVASGGGLTMVVVANEDAAAVNNALESMRFSAVQPPAGTGSPREALTESTTLLKDLNLEIEKLESTLDSWALKHGEKLVCGLELLERDFIEATAPARVAVSQHAFMIDGWIVADREDEVRAALKGLCSYIDVDTDVAPKHHGVHGHGHHNDPSPPVAFGDHGLSRPMELLTDAVGRSDYGKIDPTVFMLITYPLFFGLMLGDMLYGFMTLGLAGLIYSRVKDSGNDLGILGAKLVAYIGLSTVLFGYIYGEFAGFEILPHYESCGAYAGTSGHALADGASGECHKGWHPYDGVPAWASSFSALYPYGGEFPNVVEHYGEHSLWETRLPMGVVLAFPFHRVSYNLTDLILLTIYLGIAHLMVAFILGAIDEIRHGHGWSGAIYGKVSWMLVLGGGFFFSYAYLISGGGPSPEYAELLSNLKMGGLIAAAIGVVLLLVHLVHEGVPLWVACLLAPIEAIGMLPTTLSYVRLFAVGIVGVKIAEAGNSLLYPMIVEGFSTGGSILVAVLALIGWFCVQIFAWILGVFSPNIHAARLHFVEWMRQFYTASGKAFAPLGGRSRFVEADKGQQ